MEYFCGTMRASFYSAAIEDSEKLVVPTICVYEVFKKIMKDVGEQEALTAVATMRHGECVPLTESIAISAAIIGMQYKIPLADSIIVASARRFEAKIWTQDSHFEKIPGVKFFPK